MEEKLPNPEIINTGQIKKNPEKTIKMILGVLGLLGVLGVFYFFNINKPTPIQPEPTSKTTSAVAKVGEEELFQSDLDYYLTIYFAGQGQTAKDKALQKAIDDSIILQEGLKSGFISLNQAVFNSSYKNMASRSALIETAGKKIEQKNIKTISGEIVSMWFNNANSYPPPSIGIEKAKQTAKQKVDAIYQDLKPGKITMPQAAQRIRSDSSQGLIDPSYLGNAYSKFTNLTRDQKLFADQSIDDAVWDMSKNELSPVLLAKDLDNKNNQLFEAFYTIIKVTNTSSGNLVGLEELIRGLRSQYEIIRY